MRRVSKGSAMDQTNRESAMACRRRVQRKLATCLLHNASLAFGEGDVPSRFVLDELDVNLPSFATGLVIIVVIIVSSSTHARPLDAARVSAVAIVGRVETRRMGVWVGDVGHGDCDDGVAQEYVHRTS